MKRSVPILCVTLLLAGLLTWLWLYRSHASDSTSAAFQISNTGQPAAPTDVVTQPTSQASSRLSRQNAASQPRFPRGVRGRVLDERTRPVSGASVWLCSRGSEPPVRGSTDADGFFSLKAEAPEQVAFYSVRVLADGLMDFTLQTLPINAGVWRDIGAIRLEVGARFEGRVVAASSGEPIDGAEIVVAPMTDEPAFATLSAGTFGTRTRTGPDGRFKISSAPFCAVSVVATASGFARAVREGIHPKRGSINAYDFALVEGSSIAGRVADSAGQPIPHVTVSATEASSQLRTPILAESDQEGRFMLLGANSGRFYIHASHPDYTLTEDVECSGSTDFLQVTLKRLGCAELLVLNAAGSPVLDYEVSLRTVRPGRPGFGFTPLPQIHIKVSPGEFGYVTRLSPGRGSFVFRIEAPGYAHVFTEPFEIRLDSEPVRLFVRLDEGGSLNGVILGEAGEPLGHASVSTTPSLEFQQQVNSNDSDAVVTNLTMATAQTTSDGRFMLPRLCSGTYYMLASHPEYCVEAVGPFEVRSSVDLGVPPIRLRKGGRVSGSAILSGAPAQGICVIAVPTKVTPIPTGRFETTTDSHGNFAFRTRLPAGRYKVVAGRRTRPDPGAPIGEFPRAEGEVTVSDGEDMRDVKLVLRDK